MNKNEMNRRDFFKTAGRHAAAAAVAGYMLKPSLAHASMDANSKITVALIGCGWMGNAHLGNLVKRTDVEVAAVCDVNKPRYEDAQKLVSGHCEGYQDWRRILDRKDIDAIFVTTPDHWHALMTVWGCEAGKDIYVEKPMTVTISEGRKVVETARRYNRVVQVGMQQRTMPVYRRAIELASEGRLGNIMRTRAWTGNNGGMCLEKPETPPPDLDWEMWLGPAPYVPYSPQRYGGFRAFDDYAGGELTNWGVHLIDIALWAMKQNKPLSISAVGGGYTMPMGDDAVTMEVMYEFDGASLTWTQAPNYQHVGKTYGTMFEGDKGRLIIDRCSYVVEPESLGIPEYRSSGEYFIRLTDHHDDFFDSMRTRRYPAADCEIGHRSTSVCLLGNIAMDCRRKLYWDGEKEQFINDEAANYHLSRPYRAPWHL